MASMNDNTSNVSRFISTGKGPWDSCTSCIKVADWHETEYTVDDNFAIISREPARWNRMLYSFTGSGFSKNADLDNPTVIHETRGRKIQDIGTMRELLV